MPANAPVHMFHQYSDVFGFYSDYLQAVLRHTSTYSTDGSLDRLKIVGIKKFAVEVVCWVGWYDVDIRALSNCKCSEN
jgi:hypothetical protein